MRTLAAAAVSVAFAASVSAQSLTDPKLIVTPCLTGLSNPTGIRFTGPNEGFVIQKGGPTGTVRRFVNGSLTTVLSVPVASDNIERGLLGIALDPQYGANHQVYRYRSASVACTAPRRRLFDTA